MFPRFLLFVCIAGAACAESSTTTDRPVASSVAPVRSPCGGLGEYWTCQGGNRVRCVDGAVQSQACAAGCVVAEGAPAEAVCACHGEASARWTCGSDGHLRACNGGAAMLAACSNGCLASTWTKGGGAQAERSAECRANPSHLQEIVSAVGADCARFSPGTHCGIAVRELFTGESADHRGGVFYTAASSAKVIWVAAALFDAGIDKVKPFALPIFADSDNSAAGAVIDLLASPNRLNTFVWNDIQTPDIGFCHWNYDKDRTATNCPMAAHGDSNSFTANGAVDFLAALWGGRLLGSEKTKQLLGWMTLTPRRGHGGWLGTQLPEAARSTMHHKAGWLPPAELPGMANANEIGIVEVPNGHPYAVALLFDGAPTQEAFEQKQLPTLEYASCVIYHAMARDEAEPFPSCHRPWRDGDMIVP